MTQIGYKTQKCHVLMIVSAPVLVKGLQGYPAIRPLIPTWVGVFFLAVRESEAMLWDGEDKYGR